MCFNYYSGKWDNKKWVVGNMTQIVAHTGDNVKYSLKRLRADKWSVNKAQPHFRYEYHYQLIVLYLAIKQEHSH